MARFLSLQLHQFRNYHTATLSTDAPMVILRGPNGAGKTNILEAVSLFSPGRGLRRARLSMMSRQPEQQPWSLSAQLTTGAETLQIGTGLDPQGGEKRLVRIDGQAQRTQSVLANHLSLSWHTPQMDGLFQESDSARRRYLDRLVYGVDAAHLTRVNRYEHAMRERSKLLHEGSADDAWLGTLEQAMSQQGLAIWHARQTIIQQLNAMMPPEATGFPPAQLQLTSGADAALSDTNEQVAWFQSELRARRRRDAAAGRATFGAHRDALQVVHVPKQTEAIYCSTGEQKALLLSILLAHAALRKEQVGQAPVILLDEVVAHLDVARRASLAQALRELNTQCWLTGTDASDFSAFYPQSLSFDISEGAIRPIDVDNPQKS